MAQDITAVQQRTRVHVCVCVRVCTGEMLVGPHQALFLDEVSTGLDASTTRLITQCFRHMAHLKQVGACETHHGVSVRLFARTSDFPMHMWALVSRQSNPHGNQRRGDRRLMETKRFFYTLSRTGDQFLSEV